MKDKSITKYSVLEMSVMPLSLKSIHSPPNKIYYKGTISNQIFFKTIGVVGSRKVSSYGEYITAEYVRNLVRGNNTIVSGLMYGVDIIAHKTALANNGFTIAVLGYGIDYPVPEYAKYVYAEIIASGGLIISEYPPLTAPAKWTFVKRNRIIAGLSNSLLVTEAGEKSGALYAANHMFKQGKNVYMTKYINRRINISGLVTLEKQGGKFINSVNQIDY